jgi:hypothetical protein
LHYTYFDSSAASVTIHTGFGHGERCNAKWMPDMHIY